MIVRFDEGAIAEALDRFPKQHRVAFAAACAERLMPAYETFSMRSGRGIPDALGEILARLWEDLEGTAMTSAELHSSLAECMKLIPRESEGPWIQEQAAAEDAATAVAYALRCRLNGRAQEAAWSARRAYEALDQYVIIHQGIDVNAEDAEGRVLADPNVQAELLRQWRDIADLANADDAADAAALLRARAKTEAISYSWTR